MIRSQSGEICSLVASMATILVYDRLTYGFTVHYRHNNSFGYNVAQHFEIQVKYKVLFQRAFMDQHEVRIAYCDYPLSKRFDC